MKKCTILSFNFNGYDKLREPFFVDPEVEYIYVTDRKIVSKNWKIIIDEKLVNKNPIYSSYYVRYHPFEYANTDIVIIIDASIQLKDSLDDIINDFNADLSVMCTNFRSDAQKIEQWSSRPQLQNRLSQEDLEKIRTYPFLTEKGSTGSAFQIYKNTKKIIEFQNAIWNELLLYGSYGLPNRMDEIIFHKMLKTYNFNVFVLSIQIIQSSYMDYYAHNSDILIMPYVDYDQMYYLNNVPVKPLRYDKNINFHKSYKYNTEAILLTKYLNSNDLREWLNHHLNICKFDHIKVYDNESNYNVKTICSEYSNVDYELITGIPRQYQIYDKHFKESSAKWIMPIDDDEYLQFSEEFNSIYDVICYYENKFPHMNMLAVRWKHLFPKKFHTERTGNVLDYCTEENIDLAKEFMYLGDGTIKTIVKNYGLIHYQETAENPAGGHIPNNSTFYGAILCDGSPVLGCGIKDCPYKLDDEKIRLLHCRYKGYSEYYKNHIENKILTISDEKHKEKHWSFDNLLDNLA